MASWAASSRCRLLGVLPIADTPYHGADGVAFVIQAQKWDSLGIRGRGIGYEGIKRSVAVEYDPWRNIASDWPTVANAIRDPSDNHISVHTRGVLANNANEIYSLVSTSAIPDLADGAEHVIRVKYQPGVARAQRETLVSVSATTSRRDVTSLVGQTRKVA